MEDARKGPAKLRFALQMCAPGGALLPNKQEHRICNWVGPHQCGACAIDISVSSYLNPLKPN